MVEAWPGAKSLSVFFDVNEAPGAVTGWGRVVGHGVGTYCKPLIPRGNATKWGFVHKDSKLMLQVVRFDDFRGHF